MSDEQTGGPDIEDVAEATQFGLVTWQQRAQMYGNELDKLTAKIARVTDLMEDPDPYRQDLGPDGTFNVPCVLVSDLKEALGEDNG